MRPEKAILILQELIANPRDLGNEVAFTEWRSKVISVFRAAFGGSSEQVRQFVLSTAVKPEGYTRGQGARRDLEAWRGDAAARGMAEIRASIFALENLQLESPLDEASIDPELWVHVQNLIADSDWSKVPAAVAIFLEDKVRTWSGDPRQPNGATLVGKQLYAKALNSSGLLRLGRQD